MSFETLIMAKVDEALHRLNRIETALSTLGVNVMSALDDLSVQVQENTSVEASAVTLIEGLAAQIAANATDAAKVSALSAQLKSSASALAAAITANTPAAPPPPPATP